MRIVIAPDSFKENLSSLEVARELEEGLRRVWPQAHCVKVPMADGGEGTVEALVAATGGRVLRRRVLGPLAQPVTARWGLLGDGATAVIEMAQASGLPLVPRAQRDPLLTTTYGTGELIRAALERGVRTILVGLGGSATNDAGAGMAQALGVRLLDGAGRVIAEPACGGMLDRVSAIDARGADARLRAVRILVACDVTNPLYGPKGAAQVYGRQKGGTPEAIARLDANLRHFARLIRRDLGLDVARVPGAGAAGGLGAGLIAFAGAELRRGVDLIIKATGLEEHLRRADLVLTGEGRIDFQTAFGKTPAGVAKAARRHKVPVVAIGGGLAEDARGVFAHGIDALEAATADAMDLEAAIAGSRRYLRDAAERVARLIEVGRRMGRRRRRRGS